LCALFRSNSCAPLRFKRHKRKFERQERGNAALAQKLEQSRPSITEDEAEGYENAKKNRTVRKNIPDGSILFDLTATPIRQSRL
jgi:hypothetical protein